MVWLKAMRWHQWTKNFLLFLPLLASHRFTFPAMTNALWGFCSFCMIPSSVYLLNDVIDLEADRTHSQKKRRPLASGAITTKQSILVSLSLIFVSFFITFTQLKIMPLLIYFTAALVYVFLLKKHFVWDLICLTLLYACRIMAGGEFIGVEISNWLLMFSLFSFFALAAMKRTAELAEHFQKGTNPKGRGYLGVDYPWVGALGVCSSFASLLVYCLYISSSEVQVLYKNPKILFLGTPILMGWHCRSWIVVGRHEMPEDPVIFALKDHLSYLCLAGLFLTFFFAYLS
jgi:4-hydroxybenzoate polyprenyltransferase